MTDSPFDGLPVASKYYDWATNQIEQAEFRFDGTSTPEEQIDALVTLHTELMTQAGLAIANLEMRLSQLEGDSAD